MGSLYYTPTAFNGVLLPTTSYLKRVGATIGATLAFSGPGSGTNASDQKLPGSYCAGSTFEEIKLINGDGSKYYEIYAVTAGSSSTIAGVVYKNLGDNIMQSGNLLGAQLSQDCWLQARQLLGATGSAEFVITNYLPSNVSSNLNVQNTTY